MADPDSAAGSKGAGREALCWGLASLASVLAAATVCSLVLAWGGDGTINEAASALAFDDVPLDYKGELWLEISPRSFSVRVKAGSKLSQVRFRSRHPQQRDRHTFTLDDAEIRKRHLACPLIDGPLDLREGVVLRVDLGGSGESIVGYQAIKSSDVIDVTRLRGYAIEDFWEPIRAREDRRLILDPDQFYILASRERVQIPPDLAAEMAPIDPAIGEFRVHYAGFFDPGFGQGSAEEWRYGAGWL